MSRAKAQEAAEKSDAIWQQVYGEQPPVDSGKPSDIAAATNPEVTSPVEGTPPQSIEPPLIQDAVPPAGPIEPPADVTDDPNSDTYKQRWMVLQGMYRKAQERIEELVRSVGELTMFVAKLQMQKGDNTAATPTSNVGPSPEATLQQQVDEFREAYPTLYDGIVAQVKVLMQGSIQDLDRKITEVQKSSVQATQHTMSQVLTSKVPGWEKINSDPLFAQWLQFPDPISGIPRWDLLDDAWKKGEAERVIHIFSAYIKEHPPKPAAVVPSITPSPPLRHAAPPRSTTTVASGANIVEDWWKRSEIKAFYDAVNSHRFEGTADEIQAMDRRIVNAGAKGWIIEDVGR